MCYYVLDMADNLVVMHVCVNVQHATVRTFPIMFYVLYYATLVCVYLAAWLSEKQIN